MPPAAASPRPCRLRACDHPAVRHGYCDGHLRERRPADWAKRHEIRGCTEARLFTRPLRPLNRKTSRGYEVIDFARMIGEPLLPWQEWAVIHGLELLPGSADFRFRTILLLVARQNGKSSLKRIISLWRLYIDGARLILGCAQDVSLAREQWNYCIDTIQASADLAPELDTVRRVNGDEWFRIAGGGRYKIAASNRRAGRGLSVDELNIDELRTQASWDAWSAVSKTTQARPNGQTWAMSNAGDDTSVVLNQLRANALAGTDSGLCIMEWSAPDGCELDDVQAWAQANPALGYTIDQRAIRSSLGTDPPAVFRTEVLCQRVESLDSAVDYAAWKLCADPSVTLDGYRDRIVLGFDVAPDERHATLVAGARTAEGIVRIEAVASWASADDAWDELPGWCDRIGPVAFGWYPNGPAAAYAPMLRAMPGSVELGGGKAVEACMGLASTAAAGRVLHPADPLIDAHIAGSVKLPSGDGWRFARRGQGHCDAAYAAGAVVKVAQEMPELAEPQIRVISW